MTRLPEFGQFALILALCLSLAQAFFGVAGAATRQRGWLAAVRPAATGQFVFVAAAFVALTMSFIANDFSVLYVANNSNSALPTMYRFAAVWGAHEGSLLLWIFVLSIWTMAVAIFSRRLPVQISARVIGVMGFVSAGFLLFTILTSNPFERLWPAAIDGRDLNPLLQDPALAIHPPILYAGYVGFSVAFAFAVAAMLEGRLDREWARWTRPWTTMSWLFLTLGIALGSWWAYYELGWGGWWFWDPVENASLMPWLAGTALIHSLAVTEKRGLFKSWTLLLAISTFSLSLLGTFLVRSGVLISVHAFASDPTRGLFILAFLALVVGISLALYAWRAPALRSSEGFTATSRETFLMANNALLVVATLLVLLGTLFPLVADVLGLGKYSVGPPYFEIAFLFPMLPLAILAGAGMHTLWRTDNMGALLSRLRVPILLAVVAGTALVLVYGRPGPTTVAGAITAFWLMFSAARAPVSQLTGRGRRLPRATWGMSVAHFGLGVFILGVTVTSSYGIEDDMTLRDGESAAVAGYDFTFRGTAPAKGPNYQATVGTIDVARDGEPVVQLESEKRIYRVQRSPMTEAGIDSGLRRDLFVALGEPVGDDAWSMRFQYKPLIRLIWLGCIFMAVGGLIAVTDRRYRPAHATAPEASAAEPARAN